MTRKDDLRARLHATFDRLWRHSTKGERLFAGIVLMLTGAWLSHVSTFAPTVVQDALAWSIHGLGFERLASLID